MKIQKGKEAFAEVEVGKERHKLHFRVDTGAQADITPAEIFYQKYRH